MEKDKHDRFRIVFVSLCLAATLHLIPNPLRVNYQPLRGTAEITEGLGAAKLTDTLSLRLHLAFLSSRAACTPTIKVKAFQPDLLILRDYEGMGLFTGSAGLGWH